MKARARHRLTSAQREQLWDSEAAKARYAGLGQFPVCNLCNYSIFIGQKWHESHNRFLPHAIGGEPGGIAHERCNLQHNHKIDTPLAAKVKRIRRKHIGAQIGTARPMPFGRNDRFKRKVNGAIELRVSK